MWRAVLVRRAPHKEQVRICGSSFCTAAPEMLQGDPAVVAWGAPLGTWGGGLLGQPGVAGGNDASKRQMVCLKCDGWTDVGAGYVACEGWVCVGREGGWPPTWEGCS